MAKTPIQRQPPRHSAPPVTGNTHYGLETPPPKLNSDAILLALLCLVATILVIIVVLVILYIVRYRRRQQTDVEGGLPSSARNTHLPYQIHGLMNYTARFGTLNPIFSDGEIEPITEEIQRASPTGIQANGCTGTEYGGGHVRENDGQFTVLSPENCSSGRCDDQLVELLKTDMKESVTVTVDNKLLVFIAREIDHTGGHLVLDKMGISLFIPPCAIAAGDKRIIYLVLDWDLSDFPSLTTRQTIISPVVHCGPHGLKLHKPAILSFMHCAQDVASVAVVTSETDLALPKNWKSVGQPIVGGRHKYSLLPNNCQIYLSHFSLYTCLSEGTQNSKWIQLVIFGDKVKVGGRCQVFIYMLNNTPCALQFASQQEAKHNRVQMRCPLEFLYHAQAGDLVFQLKTLNEGWTSEGRKYSDCGQFQDIWQGKCNNVSFIFKHENVSVTDLSFDIDIFQRECEREKRSFPVLVSSPQREASRHPGVDAPSPTLVSHHITHINLNRLRPNYRSEFDSVGKSDSGMSMGPSENISMTSQSLGNSMHSLVPSVDSNHPDYDKDDSNDFSVYACCPGDPYTVNGYQHGIDHSDDVNGQATNETPLPKASLYPSAKDIPDLRKQKDQYASFSPPNQGSMTTININMPQVQHGTATSTPEATPTAQRKSSLGLSDAQPPVIPHNLRKELVLRLDPPNPLWHDWRILAAALGLDSRVANLQTKSSPTDVLLTEAVNRGKDCQWLADVLAEGSREDAARVIREYIEANASDPGHTFAAMAENGVVNIQPETTA